MEAEVLPHLLPSTNCGEHGPTTVPLTGVPPIANPILCAGDKEIDVDRPRRKVVQRSNLMPHWDTRFLRSTDEFDRQESCTYTELDTNNRSANPMESYE